MSEKRFSWIAEKIGQHYEISIRDGDEEYTISNDFFKSKDVVAVLVDLLNEQQATIKHLEEYCGDLEADVKRLMKENEQLKKDYDELLHETSKIAKRNVELDEQIAKLKKEIRTQ